MPLIIAAQNNARHLLSCNIKILKSIASLFAIAWLVVIFFGEKLFVFWLRDETVAQMVFPVFCFLFVGTTLNAIYGVGLNNILASGQVSIITKINIISFVLTVFGLPFFISKFGLIGSTSGWIAFNAVALSATLFWYFRCYSIRS